MVKVRKDGKLTVTGRGWLKVMGLGSESKYRVIRYGAGVVRFLKPHARCRNLQRALAGAYYNPFKIDGEAALSLIGEYDSFGDMMNAHPYMMKDARCYDAGY